MDLCLLLLLNYTAEQLQTYYLTINNDTWNSVAQSFDTIISIIINYNN